MELLGQTADRTNGAAIALLERLRSVAGEPHVVRFERLTAQDLTPPERVLAERRGVTPVMRISHIPTGLLDAGVVEAALEAIRRREPPGG